MDQALTPRACLACEGCPTMSLASTFLLAKTLAMSIVNLSSNVEQSLSHRYNPQPEWPAMLDKSIELYRNLSGSGRAGASEAYSVIMPGKLQRKLK